MSPDFYIPKMKTALFVAPEFTDFLVLVLCNVHIRLHQESTTRANNSDFPLWMEIACSPLYCHRKFTVEISWNFVMSVTTVLSFSYIQKKSWEIFNFVTSQVIRFAYIKISNNSATKSATTTKQTPIFKTFKAPSNKTIKNSLHRRFKLLGLICGLYKYYPLSQSFARKNAVRARHKCLW